MNAPREGRGFVTISAPYLSVTFEGRSWWFQLRRPAGEGFALFGRFHQQPVTPTDVRAWIPSADLEWSDVPGPPGMPRACEAAAGEFVVSLHANRGEPLEPEALQAEFAAFMAQGGGRRLTTL